MTADNHKPSKVVLISIDNLRTDCISASTKKNVLTEYDLNVYPNTPVLDELLSSGIFFENCYSAAPYTTSSHASIFTGVYPREHNIREYFQTKLSTNVSTIFEIFKVAGYTTIFATDFPFVLGDLLDFTRGVDYYLVEDDDEFIRLFHSHEKVFAFIHFGAVHTPFGLTSLAYDKNYFEAKVSQLGKQTSITLRDSIDWDWLDALSSRDYAEKEHRLRQTYFKCTENMYKNKEYDQLMDLYVEGSNYFDSKRFKYFLEKLDIYHLIEGGLFVLFSDHGEEYSDSIYAHYNGLFDSVVNVPFLISGKNIPKDLRFNQLIRTIDIMPTILDCANIPYNNCSLDGISLKPLINHHNVCSLVAYGETWFGKPNQIIDFMHLCKINNRLFGGRTTAQTVMQYVRDENWKLIKRTNLINRISTTKLFDLTRNPLENQDVFSEHSDDVVLRLSEYLTSNLNSDWLGQINLDQTNLSNLEQGFKDLGYL